jgi:polysaccharide biosynthesis transport protein
MGNDHQLSRSTRSKRLSEAQTVRPYYLELPVQIDAGAGSATGILEYWRLAQRYKWMLLAMTIAGALFGYVTCILRTPIYKARTSLEVLNVNANFLNIHDISPIETVNNADYDIQTQVKLLQSTSLVNRTLDQLRVMHKVPIVDRETQPAWRRLFARTRQAPQENPPSGAALANGLRVQATDKSRIVEVWFDSPNPQFAADFLNTLTSEYLEQNLETRMSSAESTNRGLARELANMKSKLEQSEKELQDYASSIGLMFTSDKDSVTQDKLRQLQLELSKAQTDLVASRSRQEMALTSSPEALPQVLDSPSMREYGVKLTDLRRQLAELSSSFTPAYYKVQHTQAQINTLQAALEKERANVLSRIENEYRDAQRRERGLAAAYNQQARLVLYQTGKLVHYDVLKRDVESNRQLYESMLQKVKEAGVASALHANNLRVVDPAEAPSAPYKPDKVVSSGLGLIAGLALGGFLAYIRERSNEKFRAPGEVPEFLSVPELGVIISAATDPGDRSALSLFRRAGALGHAVVARATGRNGVTAGEGDVQLAAWKRAPSLLAESFRTTVMSILFAGQHCRVLVFVSPVPGDGKTTMVTNLGIALTGTHGRVLIIDGDLRKPTLHRIFGLENDWGLSDLLRDETSISSIPPEKLALPTKKSGLYVLPSGSGDVNVDLFYSRRMMELMSRLRRDFDFILIDTPAMLHMSDARIMGRIADAVILVVRANHTSRNATWSARERFAQDGTAVLGTILNDWDPKTDTYGYYKPEEYYRYYSSQAKS